MRCVRSSEEACHIRGNLKLAAANRARNRGERTTVADVTSASNDTVSGGSFLSERDELMAEYKAAEKELRIIRKRFVVVHSGQGCTKFDIITQRSGVDLFR